MGDLGWIPRLDPYTGKIPWRRERLPTPVFWPGEFWVAESRSDFHFHFQRIIWASVVVQMIKNSACNVGDPGSIPGSGKSPGEVKGYHCSILAWRIPWTEEPGGLQSRGVT